MGTTQETAGAATAPVAEADSKQLSSIIMSTRDLPAMPQVAAKVLELSSDPDTSASQLQQVISDDQAMAARILKIANSAMYSCSRRIKTLTDAIVMLGFNSIRSLVVTSAARNLYNMRSSGSGLKERLMWEHSIGCAFACRVLIQPQLPGLAEEAFLAGLMHDIGKLVLNMRVPEKFDAVVQTVYNEDRAFVETERELLGFDHALVGSMLVNKWKFSPELEYVILHHHEAEALSPEQPLLLYLELANRLCHQLGIGFQEDSRLEIVDCAANQILGLPSGVFEDATRMLQETLENEMEIFI